jgi:transcriptional regulator with XRE-family HTH domain
MSTLIKELREEKGLTQVEMAKLTGVSQQAVQQWETGHSSPRGSRLGKVASILGVDANTLKRGTRAEQPVDMNKFRGLVYGILRRATPERVGKEVKVKGVKWSLDYLSENKAVDIVPGNAPAEIAAALWQLTTFQAATGKEASLVLVIEDGSSTASIVLQRITAQAALVDIKVFSTPAVEDLADLIADIEAM